MTAPTAILQAEGLTKEFLGFVAVKNVNLSVKPGSIHALIGPNGAGKTTVFNLLTKFLTPTSGRIVFEGTDVTGEQPAAVARRGLVRSFQISATFPHLTVLENIRVALQRRAGLATQFWRSDKTLRQLDGRARELIADFNLDVYADAPAVDLSYGRKRACGLEPLALGQRQAVRRNLGAALEAEPLEDAHRRLPRRSDVGGPAERADHHVLDHGERAERLHDLECAADPGMAGAIRAPAGDVEAAQRHAPGIRPVDAGDQVEAGGLAGAVGSDQRDDLAAANGEAHVVDRLEAAEALRDALDDEELVAHASPSRARSHGHSPPGRSVMMSSRSSP
jgi:ABC-type iron transport system FetAB ATPase subunit